MKLRRSRVHGDGVWRLSQYCGNDVIFNTHDVAACINEPSFAHWSLCSSELHNRLHRAIGGAVNCPLSSSTRELVEESVEGGKIIPTRSDSLSQVNGTLHSEEVDGDFESAATSVNDPVFFFLHAFFDRSLFLWSEKLLRRSSVQSQTTSMSSQKRERMALWSSFFDELKLAMKPCHQNGAWAHHRYASILFKRSGIQNYFEKQRRLYISPVALGSVLDTSSV